jgi:hypothetical protein
VAALEEFAVQGAVGEIHGEQWPGEVDGQPGGIEGERFGAGEPPAFEQDEISLRGQTDVVAELVRTSGLDATLERYPPGYMT